MKKTKYVKSSAHTHTHQATLDTAKPTFPLLDLVNWLHPSLSTRSYRVGILVISEDGNLQEREITAACMHAYI
jgi:hypothetical protein